MVIYHVYQRTPKRYLIFYSISDYIVLFSTICVVAKRCKIKLLGVCLMYDHIHLLVGANDRNELSHFVKWYSSWFSKAYNNDKGTTGPVFESRFGRAPKYRDKSIRTSIAYLLNNPVEKHLCEKAQQYRWNFLPYGLSSNPFSDYTPLRKASVRYRSALKEIKINCHEGKPIGYFHFRHLVTQLSKTERKLLCDAIINEYNVIDYEQLSAYFKNMDNLITAVNSNTGSEYDISEERDGFCDFLYTKMISLTLDSGIICNINDLFKIDIDCKLSLFKYLQAKIKAPNRQLRKFLRLETP